MFEDESYASRELLYNLILIHQLLLQHPKCDEEFVFLPGW